MCTYVQVSLLYWLHLGVNLLFGYLEWNFINSLNAELTPICHLLALLGAHHILHISRIMVNMVENHTPPIAIGV